MGGFLIEHSARAVKIIVAGVVFFLILSVFSSDPSPDTENRSQVEKSCRNDWQKCRDKGELLKYWNYELKNSK